MQKYNNHPKNNEFAVINGYILAKINLESLKAMSSIGLNVSDWRYVSMFEEYSHLLKMDYKRESIYTILSEEYKVSVSSVKRIIRRMLKQVRI